MLKSIRNHVRRRADLAFYDRLTNNIPKDKPCISFFTAMKNRFEHIKQTFPKNIESARRYGNFQWVLLNYGCTDPRTEQWVQKVIRPLTETGEVDYYHFEEPSHFRFAHARNIGLHLARGELACNVDADNYIGDDFAEYLAARLQKKKRFVRLSGIKRGAKGRICARTEDMKAIGGYDETFESWGADDGDLAERLKRMGIKQITCYVEEFGQAIEHDNKLRTKETTVSYKESRQLSHDTRRRNRSLGLTRVENPPSSIKLKKNFKDRVTLEF